MKYPKRIIYQYAYGLDLGNIDIDVLENDDEFIFDVLKLTKDKSYYSFLSLDAKKDPKILKFMIQTFNDLSIVKEYIDDYLNNITDFDKHSLEYGELIFLLAEVDKDPYNKYKLLRELYYTTDMIEIAAILNDSKNNLEDFGLGFVFVLEKYSTSAIILDYFVKTFLYEIFYKNKNLEEIFHKKIRSKEKAKEINNIEFLLDYIGNKDIFLKDYLKDNTVFLDKLSHEIDLIKRNWDNYIERINKQKCAIVYQEIKKFVDKYMGKFYFDCYYETYDIIFEMKLDKVFELDEPMEQLIPVNENELLRQHFRKMLYTLLNELFKDDVLDDKNNDYDDQKNKGEILTFKKNTI